MKFMLSKSWYACHEKFNKSYKQFTALFIWSAIITKYGPAKYLLFMSYLQKAVSLLAT